MEKTTQLSYDDMVTRSAPRWAWDIIDECLVLDARSLAADRALRTQIADALAAMVEASKAKVSGS